MKRLLTLSLLLLTLISGCVKLGPSFITTVQDHRVVTTETNAVVISTLREECESETDPINLEACEDLIERLQVIFRQAVAIEKYIMSKVTEEDMALYLRSKWRVNP